MATFAAVSTPLWWAWNNRSNVSVSGSATGINIHHVVAQVVANHVQFLQRSVVEDRQVTDAAPYALHSWVDESMHVDGDNGLYILAAVVGAADGCASIRDALRELLDEGQPKLHWGTESPERREKIMGVVAEVDMAAVVVIGAPLAKRKQERARAVCMETLVVHLAGMDVTHVLLEERTPSLNARDSKLIDAIRGKKLIPSGMRIDVGRPSAEPMLWMPDIVAGAAGADRVRGNPRYLDLIRSTVTQLDIPLR